MIAWDDIPKVTPRRPYHDDDPEGPLESDKDYIMNNFKAVLWLLDNAAEIAGTLLHHWESDHG